MNTIASRNQFKLIRNIRENLVVTIINNYTTSPSFLRADSQRGAAELTIARRK